MVDQSLLIIGADIYKPASIDAFILLFDDIRGGLLFNILPGNVFENVNKLLTAMHMALLGLYRRRRIAHLLLRVLLQTDWLHLGIRKLALYQGLLAGL
jgi:hypothetical protein